MQFSETDDIVDIRYDNVFKAVFTKDTPKSQGALSKLISTLIKREVSIVTITANEPPIENLWDRQIRFDINCRAESGERINVEMSLTPKPFEPIRLEYHAGKLFIGQDIKGADKSFDDLKESYQIAILAKKRFFADDVVFHTFEYYDAEHNIPLNGRSRIITVELSKLDKVIEKPVKDMSSAEHWAVFFQYLTDKAKREKINEIIECQEGIAMASDVLVTFTEDEIEYYRRESKLKRELDFQSDLA
ncbi:MAG: Rpn family recombination-promoting nuclease/putative transposase [Treponema sp.]|nr:Rpn family recombination-promoting nuclease/putative transposase [Treponema sp.]